MDRPSGKILDGMGNLGTRDTQMQGLGVRTDPPVTFAMVWVTLVHRILGTHRLYVHIQCFQLIE